MFFKKKKNIFKTFIFYLDNELTIKHFTAKKNWPKLKTCHFYFMTEEEIWVSYYQKDVFHRFR